MVKLKSAVDDAIQGWEDEECLPTTVVNVTQCGVLLMSMAITAQTAETTMAYLTDPSTPGFIGAAPEEISRVVTDTKSAADRAGTAAEAANVDCSIGAPTADCSLSAVDLVLAMDDLETQLLAWSPWGVA